MQPRAHVHDRVTIFNLLSYPKPSNGVIVQIIHIIKQHSIGTSGLTFGPIVQIIHVIKQHSIGTGLTFGTIVQIIHIIKETLFIHEAFNTVVEKTTTNNKKRNEE